MLCFFFFNDTATTEIYTLSLHDALPISLPTVDAKKIGLWGGSYGGFLTAMGLARNSDIFAVGVDFHGVHDRSEEHTSELQSHSDLVCRLLLEKKKKISNK